MQPRGDFHPGHGNPLWGALRGSADYEYHNGKIGSSIMSASKVVTVTTSWDDGHKFDTRLAALLKTYGVQGTFYVCPQDREFKREDLLSTQEMLDISKDFEIGGHTITHPRLSEIAAAEAELEIAQSKIYLEEILQKEVTAFCYPYGSYNDQVKALVKKHGYTFARTTKRYAFDISPDTFEQFTTLHAYSHYSDLHKILSFSKWSPIRVGKYLNWENLAVAMFDHVCEQGGMFHLWGHAWEIDAHNDWEKLEHVLSHIHQRSNVVDIVHKNNTELLN